jgi:hypothetical protein
VIIAMCWLAKKPGINKWGNIAKKNVIQKEENKIIGSIGIIFNRKLSKQMKGFKHTPLVKSDSTRDLFTKHSAQQEGLWELPT